MKKRVALIAQDSKKEDMVLLVCAHENVLRQCILLATSAIGKQVSNVLGLAVERKLDGLFGGYLQIGAEVVAGMVDCVICLRDPLVSQPFEADIQALMRTCDVHNVPYATNMATAQLLLSQWGKHTHHS
jgi:methylglyoxal synthase